MKILLTTIIAISFILIQSCNSKTYTNKGSLSVELEISLTIDDFLLIYVEQSNSTAFRNALSCMHESESNSIDAFVDCFGKQNPDRRIVALLDYEKFPEIDLRFSNVDVKAFLKKEYNKVLKSIEETIKSKIALMTDEVPIIKRKSGGKLDVQIKGIKDANLAIRLLQSSADLQFLEVYELNELNVELTQLIELANKVLNENGSDTNYLDKSNERYFQEYLQPTSSFLGMAKGQDTSMVNSILRMDEVKSIFPPNTKFYWSFELVELGSQQTGFVLYAIRQNNSMNITTRHIEDCHVSTDYSGKPCVLIQFNNEGADLFNKLTLDNIGRKIAICVNGTVTNAPMVNDAIPDGKVEITGDFTQSEAEQLAILFRVGSYPVKIHVKRK